MKLFKEELKKVEAFVFDVDGVFSRHEMSISPMGDLIRTSCTKDGYAMMYCVKKGYPVCIISGGCAPGVKERFNKLGITEVYLGVDENGNRNDMNRPPRSRDEGLFDEGGLGCVRDVVAQVLKARGDWMDTDCHVKCM